MEWMNEMFVNMETDRAAASAKRSENTAKPDNTQHVKEEIPGTSSAWSELVSSITKDVNDFNNHKKRTGQTPARISQRHFQCEVRLPGMNGKSLVLTLENNDLQVSVHPDFPKQQLSITFKLDKEAQHGIWVVGESTKESTKFSTQQLSEYLLKPVLSSASMN